jgi:hypothetical protein
VEEETEGYFDQGDGGKWKPKIKIWETRAAVFNVSNRFVSGHSVRFGEGGTFTREDVAIYIHEELAIGARVTHKGNIFTVSSQIDFADHAHGLRIYTGRRTGERSFAAINESSAEKGEGDRNSAYGKPEDNFNTIAEFWEIY